MKQVLIFPYSGTAMEALDCLGDSWQCIGFISDDETRVGRQQFKIPIYNRSALQQFPDAKILCVHGSPASFLKRAAVLQSLPIPASRFATVIHPKATISAHATIGRNVLIMAGVVITANAVIGDHVVILPNTVVHHDSIIEDLTLIAANVTIAGNVRVGKNCYLGASCSIKNGVTVPEQTLIGIGANLVHTFSKPHTLIGNPAKPLVKHAG